MSELTNGEAAPRRQRTSFEDYMARKGINDTIPEDKKMEKLRTLFACFKNASEAILDNLQPGELERRLNDPAHPCKKAHMQALMDESHHAVGLMQRCVQEMAKNPLSQVNGTSIAFAECVEACEKEQIRLETGKREFDGRFLSEKNDLSSVMPKITGLVGVYILPFVLVMEDIIAA